MDDGINFTPISNTQNASAGASDGIQFTPGAGGSQTSAPQPQSGGPSLGSFALGVGKGVVNGIDNNPISRGLTGLSAFPLQLGVKAYNAVTGSTVADPYANSAADSGVGITSSDQSTGKFAESELGNLATVGSLFVPAGEVADAVTGGAGALGVLGRIGAQTALGAGQGVAGGMQQGESLQQLGDSAESGALIGGGLSAAGELGAGIINNLADTTGTTKLQAHGQSGGAAKTLTRAFNETSTPATNPIKTMQENDLIKDLRVIDSTVNVDGITNTARTGSLDNLIQDQQDMGTQAVQQMPGGIPTSQFKNTVIAAIKSSPTLKASGQVGKMTNEIKSRFADYAKSYGTTIPYKDVNSIRVAMNKTWNPDTWDAEKSIGNTARAILYNGTGAGTTLKSALQNEQELINTKEFLAKLAGTKVKGGALTKIIAESAAAGVGAVAGAPIPVVGPALGAAASAYAAHKAVGLMQANYFNPILGNAGRSLQSFAPALSMAKRVGQAALIPQTANSGQ